MPGDGSDVQPHKQNADHLTAVVTDGLVMGDVLLAENDGVAYMGTSLHDIGVGRL